MNKLSLEELEEQLASQFDGKAATPTPNSKATPKSTPAPVPANKNATLGLLMGLDRVSNPNSAASPAQTSSASTGNQSTIRVAAGESNHFSETGVGKGMDMQSVMLLIKEGFKYLTDSMEGVSPVVFTINDGSSFLAVVQNKSKSLHGASPSRSRAQALLLLLQEVESMAFKKHSKPTASNVTESEEEPPVKVPSKPTQPVGSLNNPNPVHSRRIPEESAHNRTNGLQHDHTNSHQIPTGPKNASFHHAPAPRGRGNFHPVPPHQGHGGFHDTHPQQGRDGAYQSSPQQAVPRFHLVEASDFDKYFG